MAGPSKKTPKPSGVLEEAIEAEAKTLLQKLSAAFGDVFGASDAAAEKNIEAFGEAVAQVPAQINKFYMPIGSYLYGGAPKTPPSGVTVYGVGPISCSSGSIFDGQHFGSSSGQAKSHRVTCSTCGALRDPYVGGTLCAACKVKLDQVMDSSRELSPDEVGRALSEFVRKKLAKVEGVGDVRARGIDLGAKADDDPKS